ncbi:probable galacturonosyltransferase 4 [Magnolia sinica]|uniref:probable galacturonosyltransferase 4 n=1 Tax=Magnolia sinica TaxID=86752 RepID=UPI0026597342|nr:probable galacturonosyltransferase 4 [Magnolia sinica]
MMLRRKPVLILLVFTVLAPIVLYKDRIGRFTNPSSKDVFYDDASNLNFRGKIGKLKALSQESSNAVEEPIRILHLENSSHSASNFDEYRRIRSSTGGLPLRKSTQHRARVLSATEEGIQSEKENPIEQVTENAGFQKPELGSENGAEGHENAEENKSEQQSSQVSGEADLEKPLEAYPERQNHTTAAPDARVRQLKDQLIRGKVFLGLGPIRNNPQFVKELRLRMKEVTKALGGASKDSELQKNALEKLTAMEQTLAKGKQIQDDCSAVVKKLRATLNKAEEQLRLQKKQTLFLTQLTAKTIPKGLHCLPLRLSTEYYFLNPSQRQFPNQEKLEDPELYHYALFSDNILAAAVVVNSTVFHAKDPEKHVIHIVTDRLNYAPMRMWFLANPPGKATIQVQNIEEFTWLNSSYSPVLKQLSTASMIDYYFKARQANSDSNLKFRNPKYLSILNHLRFYLPEIFPKLNKVLFLDDDIVVQKDLTGLWRLDLKGNVNGAVETCGENFHRFDRYLNFSHPLISKNFDPRACGWAYGMNIFDLAEWRKQNITEVYHSWQRLNEDRTLWRLGTLPPGLITFWKRTFALDRSWHVLGLGYNPDVNQKQIDRAAVIHYNGNMKPWLEIGMPRYRKYWTQFVDYDQTYLQDCNINP